jgi:ribosome-binding factor A
MKFRNLRVANLIRDELGAIILREMEFPESLVTITSVDIDDKMEMAHVKTSVIPSKNEEEVFRSLRKAQGFLQHLLSHKINIRPMPFIRFEMDHGPAKAAQIEKILIEEERGIEKPSRARKTSAKVRKPGKKK